MRDTLEEKLLSEIEKTGFPLELKVANRLLRLEYHADTNVYYVDRDEGKGREVDIRALKNAFFKIENRECVIRHCLIMECKKSTSRPWVFFTSPAVSYDQSVENILSHGLSKGWIESAEEYQLLTNNHPWFRIPNRGRTFFEAFAANSEANPNILKGIMSTVKAAVELRDPEFAAKYTGLPNATFYYPMVVLDGELFTAHLSRSKLVIKKALQVPVSVYYRSGNYPRDECHTVLVVRDKALQSALKDLDEWQSFCVTRCKQKNSCIHFPKRLKSMKPKK